ncbi:hypothetical protein Slin15195_G063780 [Septoria linicola]|uniref:Uncharacterized protein n=1 Tax=Septoria linicola TaxID=215465 RepID=A0A9Q9APG7_9PEZI|nr:hypothetical protein Slin15195_G063780 [Septoria linicola]
MLLTQPPLKEVQLRPLDFVASQVAWDHFGVVGKGLRPGSRVREVCEKNGSGLTTGTLIDGALLCANASNRDPGSVLGFRAEGAGGLRCVERTIDDISGWDMLDIFDRALAGRDLPWGAGKDLSWEETFVDVRV